MRRGPLSPPVLWGLAVLLTALLVTVAVLQYRWVGEVSRAEQQRTHSRALAAAHRFAEELNREIFRGALLFLDRSAQPTAGSLAAAWQRWEATALVPQLVAQVWIETLPDDGLFGQRFDPATGTLASSPWPSELSALVSAPPTWHGPRGWGPVSVDVDIPAVVVFGPPSRRGPGRPGERGRVVALKLDRAVLAERLLPLLIEKHFGPGEPELSVAVVRRSDGREILHAGPQRRSAGGGNLTLPLLSPLPLARHEAHRSGMRHRRILGGLARGDGDLQGPWLLVVAHPAGSLERAVAQARRRNLALSSVILALLAGSVALLFVSTKRALALARRQLDFVAGVSHELLTPLAAIRSAGQNLADGVVAEPERVSRYGGMILREGDRLTELVRRVLAVAGIESGGAAAGLAPVPVGKLVEEALETHQAALAAGSMMVETAVARDLPPVHGDAAALRRALDNLIGNAVKYGAEGGWLRVEASALDGQGVEIAVSDRGKGIAAADLSHVFERFYRGRDLAGSRIPGAGLGLALVKEIAEAHGGSVRAESTPGSITRVALRLPAAREPAV